MKHIDGFSVATPLRDKMECMTAEELRAAQFAAMEAIAGISSILGSMVRAGTEEQMDLWRGAMAENIRQSGVLGRRYRHVVSGNVIPRPKPECEPLDDETSEPRDGVVIESMPSSAGFQDADDWSDYSGHQPHTVPAEQYPPAAQSVWSRVFRRM